MRSLPISKRLNQQNMRRTQVQGLSVQGLGTLYHPIQPHMFKTSRRFPMTLFG
uniref:Uncharacterized protein n=1 Tax=Setaria italica TaxID=4555 RepID=K3Y4C5_SETIT